MLGYDGLSIGAVAGMIAAGVFVIQFLAPSLLTLILVGFLKQEETAATWSVLGRTLHSSHWPVLLRADTAGVEGVRRSVKAMTIFQLTLFLLVSIASIVTPLGLYETVAPKEGLNEQPFRYAKDNTSIGVGTMPRRNDIGLSRYCGIGISSQWPAVCPWSNTTIQNPRNSSEPSNLILPGGYDRRIPRNLTEIYRAGQTRLSKTVSSAFDIQWRNFQKGENKGADRDGQPYLVGSYRHLQQTLLNDAWEVYEGLIVDTKTGGIGFRNHTIPATPLPYGASWTEDILFIEPETECVDTNITLDFRNLTETPSLTDGPRNITIVDHGGFASLNREVPSYNKNKTWENASLRERAYFLAWWSNRYTMYFLNITNPKGEGYPDGFHYLNSKLGAKFPVDNGEAGNDFTLRAGQLRLDDQLGSFLRMRTTVYGTPRNGSRYTNPYKITRTNFTNIDDQCKGGIVSSDYANISNIAITCGLVYGTPKRLDGGNPLEFALDVEWTTPLYSCASASRASIKTVTFAFNGTVDLRSLRVTNIQPKTYISESEKPLWAVEKTESRLSNVQPIWGITTPEFAQHPNISTARQGHLYLPGYSGPFQNKPFKETHNFAGVDFYHNIMAMTYGLEDPQDGPEFPMPDYTGRTNFALFTKWRELSANSSSAGKIINLLWTDISANAVVGTRGQLLQGRLQDVENPASNDVPPIVMVPVTTYTRKIRYHLPYGIPAFIVLLLFALIALLALVFLVIGRAKLSKLQRYLDDTSVGRIYTKFLYREDYPPDSRHAVWVNAVGKKHVDVSGSHPRAVDVTTSLMTDLSDSDRK